MNQSIHNLDALQWLLGMPDGVFAEARFGKYHDIEVEDEVSALFSYESGLTGTLVTSTGEAPGINRLDIVGELGTLTFDGETLTIDRALESVAEHCANTRSMFGVPEFKREPLTPASIPNQHAEVLTDFVEAVLDGKPLATPLTAGISSIELANAMLLSAWVGERIALPLDAERYSRALEERLQKSQLRRPQDIEVEINMEDSYR